MMSSLLQKTICILQTNGTMSEISYLLTNALSLRQYETKNSNLCVQCIKMIISQMPVVNSYNCKRESHEIILLSFANNIFDSGILSSIA